ncbi:hypothetical protein GGD65_005285 [Bradyrhizobium sp. CIR18]|uniref:hypothetical protein n=1 Tax=Bradyrhizobium sp. CIR18 TaxID=2663839 RepID=UPI0018423FD9|nr:hypothetical protein [Bradyrhizobium sp. CIR18]MBB4364227.1 hypothetical protein [Bradyrhizobium sp. CIR18]
MLDLIEPGRTGGREMDTREVNRLRIERSADIVSQRKELERVQRDLDRAIQAILDGVPGAQLKDKIGGLEARKAELTELLVNAEVLSRHESGLTLGDAAEAPQSEQMAKRHTKSSPPWKDGDPITVATLEWCLDRLAHEMHRATRWRGLSSDLRAA